MTRILAVAAAVGLTLTLTPVAANARPMGGGSHGGAGFHGGGGFHGGRGFGGPGFGRFHGGGRGFVGGFFWDPFFYAPPYYYYPYYPYGDPYGYGAYPPPPPPDAYSGWEGGPPPDAEAPGPEAQGEESGPEEGEVPDATYGLVQLRGVPNGASVDLDGRFWMQAKGLDDRWLALPRGSHTVRVRMEGHRSVTRTVEVTPGKNAVVRIGSLPRS